MALGRITGPLLKADLIRDGVDLAFETDLLYLNVSNGNSRVGINTSAPVTDLHINGDTRTTNLIVDNQLNLGNITITGNTISSNLDTINFLPSTTSDPTIYQARLIVDDIQITGNKITTEVSNSNLELKPNGSGIVDIQSSTLITGNLDVLGNINATGNVVIGGNIIIGDEISDTITINARIKSSLIPETNNLYDLGTPDLRWRAFYVAELFTDFINVIQLDVGSLSFTDNKIESTTNQNIEIQATGTGSVRIENFAFSGNIITNTVSGAVSQFTQTGTGYFKISGTNGFIPPVGNDAQRPTAYAVEGMTRYNTVSRSLEIWDGFAWSSPAGQLGAVSEVQANDIAAQMALTLG